MKPEDGSYRDGLSLAADGMQLRELRPLCERSPICGRGVANPKPRGEVLAHRFLPNSSIATI